MPDAALTHHARDEPPLRIDLLADPSLADDDATRVLDYLLGRFPRRRVLDGARSVVIRSGGSAPSGGIKIKGAGFRGSTVQFDTPHAKPYALPRYDAEGAATIDAAKDHGRAVAGGMSYQQSRQEFVVSRHLVARGARVLSPLGYGVVRRGASTSWFCLLDTHFGEQRAWWELTRRRSGVERVARAFGETQRELATHDVYLALGGLMPVGDEFVRKDFHTAHIAGPNDTFLTRLAYYLFDTNFILAQFAFDRHMPDVADHRELARRTYLCALTGHDFSPLQIEAFKKLLVELKFADWPMEERVSRLADDPIGNEILREFAGAGSEGALLRGAGPRDPSAREERTVSGPGSDPQRSSRHRLGVAFRRRQPT